MRMARIVMVAILLSAFTSSPTAARVPPLPDGTPFIGNGTLLDFRWYNWLGDQGGWIDEHCGTSSAQFKVDFYEHKNQGGLAVRICHSRNPGNTFFWCNVPLRPDAAWWLDPAQCALGDPVFHGMANDRISSYVIRSLGQNACVALFRDQALEGPVHLVSRSRGDVANLDAYGFNDQASSLKKCDGAQAQ